MMFDADSSSFSSHEDDHGVDGQDDGAVLVADVAIAVLPSQLHLAICHTATYSAPPPPQGLRRPVGACPCAHPVGGFTSSSSEWGLMLWGFELTTWAFNRTF